MKYAHEQRRTAEYPHSNLSPQTWQAASSLPGYLAYMHTPDVVWGAMGP